MKLFAYLLLFFSFTSNISAQHWLQPGATYNYYYQVQMAWRYEQIKYVKDTIVQGRVCSYAQKHTQFCYSGNGCNPVSANVTDYFFNRQNDSVFIAWNGNWRFLFNLNPQVGDEWYYGAATGNAPCNLSNITVVDSIKFDTVNNIPLKKIYVHPKSGSQYGYRNYITDRYGTNLSYIDWYDLSLCPPTGVSPYYHGLTCYSDSLYPGNGNYCNSPFVSQTSLEDFSSAKSFKVFPNPAKNNVQLMFDETAAPFINIKLYNFTGQMLVEHQNVSTKEAITIDLKSFTEGLFFVEIESDKGKELLKIIKEN